MKVRIGSGASSCVSSCVAAHVVDQVTFYMFDVAVAVTRRRDCYSILELF
jgi:hypothetical protein